MPWIPGLTETTTSTTTTTTKPENFLSYVPGRIQVFVNGHLLRQDQYIATDGLTVTLVNPVFATDIVTISCLDITPVSNPGDFYYVFLGRTLVWGDPDEAATPEDTRIADAETKRNIMAVKRIAPSDTSLMIRRIDWEEGVIYPAYRDDIEVSDTDFYVMNTSYRIYKCIYSPGTPTTAEGVPAHTSVGPLETADGYVWELIYEIPVSDRLKFLTSEYIPVKFYSTSSTFDHTGLLDYIIVTNGGTGYDVTPPSINILGDGYGAMATAEVTAGVITGITLTDGGAGYSFAIVSLTGGDSNATATAVLRASDLPMTINQNAAAYAITTAGAINNIVITDAGLGYINDGTTVVTIVGDGSDATADAPVIDDNGRIIGIPINQRGSGYTWAEVVITPDTSPTTPATAKVVIEPQGGHGSNIPQELFSTIVGVTVYIEDLATDFFTNNDFRQIGIITNIKQYGEIDLFIERTGNACYVVDVPDGGEYSADDVLTTDDGGEFVVANVAGDVILLLPLIDAISGSSIITNVTKATGPLYIDDLTAPEVSTKLGNIIYIRNVDPIERELGQAEQLKLYFSF